jgi:hypothetical protein
VFFAFGCRNTVKVATRCLGQGCLMEVPVANGRPIRKALVEAERSRPSQVAPEIIAELHEATKAAPRIRRGDRDQQIAGLEEPPYENLDEEIAPFRSRSNAMVRPLVCAAPPQAAGVGRPGRPGRVRFMS